MEQTGVGLEFRGKVLPADSVDFVRSQAQNTLIQLVPHVLFNLDLRFHDLADNFLQVDVSMLKNEILRNAAPRVPILLLIVKVHALE